MTHGADQPYVLGHSESELQRLIMQARFFGDLTREVFQRAGISAGMRVLDVGCGAGDVTFLAASLVGETGSVLGVDKSPDAIALARQRAEGAKLKNIRFETADLADVAESETFDAIVGRLILLYIPDAPAALRALAAHLKPAGVMVFQEVDLSTARCEPSIPLFESHLETIRETLRRAGVIVDMGSALYRTYRAAGLRSPEMIGHIRVEASAESDVYEQLAGIARALLPLIERFGVATAASLDLPTFPDRLRKEVIANEAVIIAPLLVGAWSRI